jgi:hypothetical protein
MKIYFNAAVSSKPEYGKYYERIVQKLISMGHEVNADHILGYSLNEIVKRPGSELRTYYKDMVRKISQSEIMVAEVSFPSTVNVGHELSIAIARNKPILALHKKDRKPVLFWGLESDKFFNAEYDDLDLEKVLERAIDNLKDHTDTRFNFFISKKLLSYLDWISKNRRIPRAVYLRNLLNREMRKYPEFRDRVK